MWNDLVDSCTDERDTDYERQFEEDEIEDTCEDYRVAQVGGTHLVAVFSRTHSTFCNDLYEHLVVIKNLETGEIASADVFQEEDESCFYKFTDAYEIACHQVGVEPCWG